MFSVPLKTLLTAITPDHLSYSSQVDCDPIKIIVIALPQSRLSHQLIESS